MVPMSNMMLLKAAVVNSTPGFKLGMFAFVGSLLCGGFIRGRAMAKRDAEIEKLFLEDKFDYDYQF